MDITNTLQRRIAEVLPTENYAIATQFLKVPVGRTFPEEQAYIAHAVPKRIREFLAGRACAHRAITTIGGTPIPLLAHENRILNWPSGLIGSIAHSNRIAIAIIAKTKTSLSVGIDLEEEQRLKPNLWALTLNPAEIAWVKQQPSQDWHMSATLIFSAKECFYKYQYPMTQAWLGFHDVEISIDLVNHQFAVKVCLTDHPAIALPPKASGFYVRTAGHVITVMV